MAIKRSTPGQSYLNKPIGVVNVRTGADQKYAAKAQELAKVSDFALSVAKTVQVKEGQAFADRVRTRNEDNTINYEKPPITLGALGRKEAESALAKKYNLAQKQDAMETAAEFRSLYKTEEEFNRNYREYMTREAQYAEQIGGEKYANMFLENAEAVRFEHSMNIKNERLRSEQIATKARFELDMKNQIGSMADAYAAGDFAEGDLQFNLIQESLIEDGIDVFGLTGEKQRELLGHLKDSQVFNKIRNATKGYSSRQLKLLDMGITSGNIDPKFLEDMPFLEQALEVYEVDRRKLNTFMSDLTTSVTAAEQQVRAMAKADELMNHQETGYIPENSKANRDALDSLMAARGVTSANMFSSEARDIVASVAIKAPFASNEMVRSFQALRSFGEYTDEEIINANSLYNNIKVASRNNVSDYGLKEQNNFLIRFNSLMKTYGNDPQKALAFARRIPQNSPEDLQSISQFTGMKTETGEPMKDMSAMMSKYIKQNLPEVNPEHVSEMTDYAIAVALSDPANWEDVISDTYLSEYKYSQYLLPSAEKRVKNGQARSRYAPESVFDRREELPVFKALMDNMLLQFHRPEVDAITGKMKPYKKPVLGEDFYIKEVVGSDTEVIYKFVKPDGTSLINADGKEVSFGYGLLKTFMERRKQQDAARAMEKDSRMKLRTDKIIAPLNPVNIAVR